MHHKMKMTLAALACLALIPAVSTAHTVKSPFPGTVTATTYYSSGAFHGALDISSGRCNYWGVQTGVVGSVSWAITIRTTGIVCNGNGSGNQNEARHVLANGQALRLWHFNKTAASYDKTCDRCELGSEGGTGNVTGPVTHIQVDLNGTKDTSWYSGYVTKGQYVDAGTIIGVL